MRKFSNFRKWKTISKSSSRPLKPQLLRLFSKQQLTKELLPAEEEGEEPLELHEVEDAAEGMPLGHKRNSHPPNQK